MQQSAESFVEGALFDDDFVVAEVNELFVGIVGE